MGGTIVKPEIHTFRGSRTSAGWCPLLHAYCWKKVWLSEVPCQHTTSSQHVRVCLVGLEITSNTARGVFGPFPADCVTESLFYHNGKHFCVKNHVFTTMAASIPEILLLENIMLSPTDVSQEPCHSGAVSASSYFWLFLVSMFPLGGKWHKLPPLFLVGFPVIHLAWHHLQQLLLCPHTYCVDSSSPFGFHSESLSWHNSW